MDSKDNKNNNIFWIPMKYNFYVRLKKNISKFVSWLFINIFPTTYYALITVDDINSNKIFTLILFTIGVFFMYEWGYIYNDTTSIKKEKNPSIRLSNDQLIYAQNNKIRIFSLRLVVFCLCMYFVTRLNINSLTAIIIATTCPIIFFTYNNIRSKYNVFIYFILVTSRFIPFIFLFKNNLNIILILIILIYPLEIGLERFSITKYRFQIFKFIIPNEESKIIFRFIYYIIISIILTILLYLSYIPNIKLILPFYIFTIYRLILIFNIKRICHNDTHNCH